MNLRDYQIDAINKTRDSLRINNSVVLCAPTGSGKTVIAAEIIRLAIKKNKKVLFVAHRRELIAQCSAKLKSCEIDHGILLGSVDKTLKKLDAPVQIASIQTLMRRELVDADLIIIDECHRGNAKSYKTLLANYDDIKVIGLTATPYRLDGKGLREVFSDLIIVTDIKTLVANGYLIKPDYYAGEKIEGLEDVSQLAGDYAEDETEYLVNKKEIIGNIIKEYQRYGADRQGVIFAVSIEHSKNIVVQFNNCGIKAEHVDGKTPILIRDEIINKWKAGEIKLVSNVNLFIEGFDFPELEVCILARPTKSLTIYLQSVGRVMRPAINKQSAIILDHANCYLNHGLPINDRDWTLNSRSKYNETYYHCKNCHHVFSLSRHNTIRINRGGKLIICEKCRHIECANCLKFFNAVIQEKHNQPRLVQCLHCLVLFKEYILPVSDSVRNEIREVDGVFIKIDQDSINQNSHNNLAATKKRAKDYYAWLKLEMIENNMNYAWIKNAMEAKFSYKELVAIFKNW